MRYLYPAKAIRSIANTLRGRHLNVDDLSDYMRRDIGLIDGRPTVCGAGFAEDNASSRFDRLALTPYAA
jgi:hypothetical protein